MFKEFKQFINKGNVVEMAVGLIFATYFGAIIKSLVNDIIMPPIGKLLGGVDFAQLKYIIQVQVPEQLDATGVVTSPAIKEIAISYGIFFNAILTFIIVAFTIFILVKKYNKMKENMKKKEEEEKPAEPPKPTKEEILLSEIRDLLKDK